MPGFLNIVFGAISSAVTDAYFYLTTLLLSGDGTNGAQNNTFLDSSSNNFTITRNGNTTQGTFSPFSQTGWSVYFDGSNDYIDTPASGVFAPTGDFTIGAHFYLTGLTNSRTIISNWTGNNATDWEIMVTSAGTMQIYTNGSTIRISSSAGAIATNTWYYVALCRSGTTITAYLNGTSIGTYTQSGTFGSSAKKIEIGSEPTGVATFLGYISNVWLVDGQAITTVPTSPITTTFGGATASNVKLLTCQSNRFIDNSNNAFALTRSGDASIQAFSPFAPTAAYDAATNGASGYFDGAGDYLQLPAGSVTPLTANSDFTLECWVYLLNYAGTYNGIVGGGTNDLALSCSSSSSWGLYIVKAGGAPFLTTGMTVLNGMLNRWAHVAVTRSGNAWNIWVDGVSVASTTNAITFTDTAKAIGAEAGGSWPSNSYVSNVRYTSAAIYSATFTPPTAPFTTAVPSGTCRLLCNFTNAGIINATGDSVLETVGTAQISTAQKKFGSGSLYFDGTNNTSRAKAVGGLYNLGTSDFTIEFWYYPTSHNTTGYPVLWTNYESWISGTTYSGLIGLLAGNKDRTPVNAVWLTLGDNFWQATTTVPSLNTWTHVALVRTGNRYLIFINGTKEVDYTATSTITFNANNMSVIGGGIDSAGLNRIYGYIDDFRQTNYARYTANFTPPTEAYPLQ